MIRDLANQRTFPKNNTCRVCTQKKKRTLLWGLMLNGEETGSNNAPVKCFCYIVVLLKLVIEKKKLSIFWQVTLFKILWLLYPRDKLKTVPITHVSLWLDQYADGVFVWILDSFKYWAGVCLHNLIVMFFLHLRTLNHLFALLQKINFVLKLSVLLWIVGGINSTSRVLSVYLKISPPPPNTSSTYFL